MFHLSIATLEKVIFEEEIHSVSVPGVSGYMEVLANHAPILALLQKGKVTVVTQKQERQTYTISGGLLEVALNKAILLADEML